MRFQFKTSYHQEINLYKDAHQGVSYLLLLLVMLLLPFCLSEYYVGELIYVLIFSLAGLGLMLLVGHTGLVSLGHAAFLAVGAYSCVNLEQSAVPFWLAFPLSGLITGLVGVLLAMPILRLSGIYLAIATMALSLIIEDIILLAEPWTGGVIGLYAEAIDLWGYELDLYGNPKGFYYFTLAIVILVTIAYANLLRARTGRALIAIRDSEVSAKAMGIGVAYYKCIAFGLSCTVTGLAGALLAHYLGAFNHETFLILTSIQLLMMVVVGGLGSIHGAFLGAIVIGVLPTLLSTLRESWDQWSGFSTTVALPGLDTALFAVILMLVILLEPQGLYGRWLKVRTWFELFPLYRKGMFKRHRTYLKTERVR